VTRNNPFDESNEENAMRIPQGLAAVAIAVFVQFAPLANAASTTNFSDQWWNPNESGWGASFLQQGDIIFIDLFVYGTDGRPTWFTAAANYQGETGQGHLIFTGALYITNGPFFGGPFNPNNVGYRQVGTLTFDASGVDTGTLTYSVDGIPVSKSVTRQLWEYEDFTGSYYGGLIYDLSGCANPADNGHVEDLGTLNINHAANNSITMATQTSLGTCNYAATYSQAGHMGTMQGTFSCNNGIGGTFTAFEMEKTISGMTGRFTARDNFCSSVAGHLGGILR
jgi:hypothetical protein